MRKEDKAIIIEKIGETLKEYSCFYLTDTTSMDAEQTSAFRRACFNAEVKMMVVKNTLLHKALEQLEGDYSELYPALTGTTAMLFSNVGNAPAKAIKEFHKKGSELPVLKAAYVEETVYMGADQLDTFVEDQEQERAHRRGCCIAPVTGQERCFRTAVVRQQVAWYS